MKILDYSRSLKHWELIDDCVIEYISRAGFLIPSKMRLDRPLLTALIERWRPETSTFHLQEGEMTLTLQDAVVLLGIRIDGPPVTSTDERDWVECDRLLGVVPPPTAIHGGQVKLIWLREQFTVPPITDMEAQQHAHAYILHMIGTQLFPDYSKNKVYLR